MMQTGNDEWRIIESLLPQGWEEAARTCKAFQRARYTMEPSQLLRLILFHAINDGGLRETVAQAKLAGIADMSQVALLKRLRTSGEWLEWIGARLCDNLRHNHKLPSALHPKAVDSTSLQAPASTGTTWRVHYTLDLVTLHCDHFELTTVKGGESFARSPISPGDLLIGDRNYLNAKSTAHVVQQGGHVLARLRVNHATFLGPEGQPFKVINYVDSVSVGKVASWDVIMACPDNMMIPGRVIITKLPAPLAAQAERRKERIARRKNKAISDESLKAAHYIMVFTTVPEELASAEKVLDIYRFRWQIELAFKRLKQLLSLGRLPHKNPEVARSWILAKLIIALLLEKLHRNSGSFSPWGYDMQDLYTRIRE